jgi:hypothetical protein
MQLLSPQAMQQLFEVTDELGIDREAIEVPLEMEGEGGVERLASGKLRIRLPEPEDLGTFLETLPQRLAESDGESAEGA